ncbi:MAG TPA: Holliday junction branch migration protein RuvA, partial [Clostridia bacterium]|nr:Holliday junction branch migration protein RuvA [Clostridia bacterium]
LTKIPGIGKKTAQRLILELKDKAANYYHQEVGTGPAAVFSGPDPIFRDAFNGLLSLGYSSEEVTPLLVNGREILGEESPAEDLIRFVLKEIARARR